MYKNILVAVDLKEHSEKIVKKAAEFAFANNADLIIVHVFEAVYLEGGFDAYLYNGFNRETHGANQVILNDLKDIAMAMGCKNVLTKVVTSTSVSGCINYELEEEYDIDLIVIGHNKKQGISKVVAGNIPSTVVRNSKCDVFVVN